MRRMSGRRETAVLKKEDSRLAVSEGMAVRTEGEELGREEPSRFLKQQIIFPIYEDAREKARQV